MTNLRVFDDPLRRRPVEVSSVESTLSRVIFLPVLGAGQEVSKLLNRSEVVEARFESEILRIPFLLLLSRKLSE